MYIDIGLTICVKNQTHIQNSTLIINERLLCLEQGSASKNRRGIKLLVNYQMQYTVFWLKYQHSTVERKKLQNNLNVGCDTFKG